MCVGSTPTTPATLKEIIIMAIFYRVGYVHGKDYEFGFVFTVYENLLNEQTKDDISKWLFENIDWDMNQEPVHRIYINEIKNLYAFSHDYAYTHNLSLSEAEGLRSGLDFLLSELGASYSETNTEFFIMSEHYDTTAFELMYKRGEIK